MERLAGHAWPGNVRELRHVLERAAVMSAAEVLDVADLNLPAGPLAPAPPEPGDLNLKRATAALEAKLVRPPSPARTEPRGGGAAPGDRPAPALREDEGAGIDPDAKDAAPG